MSAGKCNGRRIINNISNQTVKLKRLLKQIKSDSVILKESEIVFYIALNKKTRCMCIQTYEPIIKNVIQ